MRWGDGFILVYDITDRGSFEDMAPLKGLLDEVKRPQTGASGAAGKQGGSGPRPAGGHGGGRASGGRHGLRVLRVLGVFGSGGDGRRRDGGVSRALQRDPPQTRRSGQNPPPQLHHTRQASHQQDADQDQQLKHL